MVEVQDIFLKYGNTYRTNHKLTLVQHKAMSAIQKCRSSQLGGHKEVCDSCGHTRVSYNSCRKHIVKRQYNTDSMYQIPKSENIENYIPLH